MEIILFVFMIILLILAIKYSVRQRRMIAKMPPAEREAYLKDMRLNALHGNLNPAMVCPHCNEKGQIRTQRITNKKGISGGKATAALFTGGLSVLATGLSRKENSTQAHCCNCNNTWEF